MSRRNWRSESLRTELIEKIEQRPDLGYTRVAEFIADAARRRLEEISRKSLRRLKRIHMSKFYNTPSSGYLYIPVKLPYPKA